MQKCIGHRLIGMNSIIQFDIQAFLIVLSGSEICDAFRYLYKN